jgi:ribosomal protein S18 acetylase RimI-like enzyme
MIPSSPSITIEDQLTVIKTIHQFILYNQDITVCCAFKKDIIDFLPKINSSYFRYFDSRTIDCLQNHITTLLFKSKDEIFGYTHIDKHNDKYWFGIYIVPEFRHKKLGKLLMNYTIQNNIYLCNTIYLTVDSNNIPAIQLYKKYGFIEINTDNNKITMKYL